MSGPTSLPTRTTGAIVSESSQERVPGTQASTPEPTRLKRGRSRWRRWRTTLIVLGVLVLVGGGWRLTHPPKPPAAPPVGEVKLADITQLVQASGILQARTKVDVGAQVSGQVQTLHVELGQNVKKGDLLVSLDPEIGPASVVYKWGDRKPHQGLPAVRTWDAWCEEKAA